MAWQCLSAVNAESTALLVSVVPNAKRTEAVGLHDGCLRVRLAAPALEGRANDELIAWLADQLGVARREVVLQQGASSRRKRLVIAIEPDRVMRWLDGLQLPLS
ncbi:DUF167 domain-containing protein [Ideonella sp. BN130291]|uniref:DUF167 domain-containing protein n=1 Tax=Ideonella sp. BN130291 TaxID=3112940 RepID=UPI002E27721A|nr:DUF167 domain-containing protein [Ideonella sp. BN130291]